MKIPHLVITAAALAVLAGCAGSTASVIPQAGGNYKITAKGESEDDALKDGLAAAEKTCKARNMRHVVSDQKTAYKGVLSESTSKAISKGADLAAMAGKFIPTLSDDTDYEVTLQFKCES